jgi:phosphopantothenoylcysteine decarboxylase/phosphopantothenate--cysteine ligase
VRNLALGVGGGIAAYKAAELARLLMQHGFRVQTIMTRAAQEFVQPLTFSALTGHKTITSLWDIDHAIQHIAIAQENEVLLVAPATADLLAKFAHGLADDFLSTMYLAFTGTVILAPAMNTNMWNHPATQANLATLRTRGHHIIEPESGPLACGTTGPGRLAEPERIAADVVRLTSTRTDLSGETVLLTAGPTQEAIDPVRFISNRSSGKMGYALAEAAAARGARVILISGPVSLPVPSGVEIERVRSAQQMRDAVLHHLPEATIIIKTAAVADYHVSHVLPQKRKKTPARWSLDLDPTPDILAEVGRLKGDRLLIGFAAETENLAAEARRKLETKNADMVVGNLVNQESTGFEADDNEVTLVLRTGETLPLPRASKRELADKVFDAALKLRLALHAR